MEDGENQIDQSLKWRATWNIAVLAAAIGSWNSMLSGMTSCDQGAGQGKGTGNIAGNSWSGQTGGNRWSSRWNRFL